MYARWLSSSLEIIRTALPTSGWSPKYFRNIAIWSAARCSVTRLCARYVMTSSTVSGWSALSLSCARPMPCLSRHTFV
ncbi:hypothetical protein SALBM311S_09654 [Streptomyces alboniger]